MKLRVNKRLSGKYFIEVRNWFIWSDIANNNVIKDLFLEGLKLEHNTEEYAILYHKEIFKRHKARMWNEYEEWKCNRIDKSYKPKIIK